MATAKTTTPTEPTSPKPDPFGKPDAVERPALETAIDSARRSRNAATRQGDRQLVAVLLRTEAALLELAAIRAEQGMLAYEGGHDAP